MRSTKVNSKVEKETGHDAKGKNLVFQTPISFCLFFELSSAGMGRANSGGDCHQSEAQAVHSRGALRPNVKCKTPSSLSSYIYEIISFWYISKRCRKGQEFKWEL